MLRHLMSLLFSQVWVLLDYDEAIENNLFEIMAKVEYDEHGKEIPDPHDCYSSSLPLANWLKCKSLQIIISKPGDMILMSGRFLHGTCTVSTKETTYGYSMFLLTKSSIAPLQKYWKKHNNADTKLDVNQTFVNAVKSFEKSNKKKQ